MHWKTHIWPSRVNTQRSDRTGVERDKKSQDAPVDFTGDANCQHLIDTMRKRLCGCASKETREYAEDFKAALRDVQPELSDVLVPNCVYRCGCPEMKSCGMWHRFRNWYKEYYGVFPEELSIQERYDAYNAWFNCHREV